MLDVNTSLPWELEGEAYNGSLEIGRPGISADFGPEHKWNVSDRVELEDNATILDGFPDEDYEGGGDGPLYEFPDALEKSVGEDQGCEEEGELPLFLIIKVKYSCEMGIFDLTVLF